MTRYVERHYLYACLDSGRPILLIGSAESDVELLAGQTKAGYWRVVCLHVAGFADRLEALADQKNLAETEPTGFSPNN